MTGAQPDAVSGLDKAAVLMILLGDDAASGLYSHLPREQWRQLTRKIAALESIPAEVAAGVLEEYRRLSATQQRQLRGGAGYAQKVLTNAFGRDEAENLLEHVVFAEEESARNFERLQQANPAELAGLLAEEHPQTIALVLSHLGPKSAAILKRLPDPVRVRVVERLARMQRAAPELVRRIAAALCQQLSPAETVERAAPGGARSVARLLNQLDAATAKTILDAIAATDAELATEISDLMFTFEDLVQVPDAGIREFLAEADKKVLTVALRKASAELKAHIFRSMSSRAVEMIEEDMAVLDAVRSSEVVEAQKQLVALARRLDAEGKLTLRPEQDEKPDH